MEKLKESIEETNVLSNEKVVIRPIRRKGGWHGMLESHHDSAFMNVGAKMRLCVPMSESAGTIVDPLKEMTDSEKIFLKNRLSLDSVEKFNIYNEKCFWRKFEIIIDRNGLVLDLNNIMDFMKLKVFECNTELIAPNWKSRLSRGTYRFAICREKDEHKAELEDLSDNEKAYMFLGEMSSSAGKLKDFLYLYYMEVKGSKPPPKTTDIKLLKAEVGKILKSNIKTFLRILEDPHYSTKLLIRKAVKEGELIQDKHNYLFKGSDDKLVLEDMIAYLEDDRYQTEKLKLIQKVGVF